MRRFSVAALGLAAVALVAAGCGDDNGGDSREEVEREIAGQRLEGCLAETGFDFGEFEGELGEAIQAFFQDFEDVEEIDEVIEFFGELDSALSDDFSDYGLSDEFSDEVSDLSVDYSEFDEGVDEGEGVEFFECLGFSQDDLDQFEEEFSEGLTEDFTDEFTENFTDDEFTDDFS